MTRVYKNEWEPNCELKFIGDFFVSSVFETFKQQIPEYFEFSPFKSGWKCQIFHDNELFCLRLEEIIAQLPHMGEVIKDEELVAKAKLLFSNIQYPSFTEAKSTLGESGYTLKLFTYVGRVEGKKLSWPHIVEQIIGWLNEMIVPRIMEMNKKRVTDAIPTPPTFDTGKLLENVFVIESESGLKQGTAFHLKNHGIITCDHCIRNEDTDEIFSDLKIYRGNDFQKKFPVKILKTNKDIDLTILETDISIMKNELEIGSSDTLNQLNHIGVAGFPNYNFGDNGIFSPGLVIGFRTYSGLRHILVNSPLISGNSGGPAFDKDSKVIGVAVTGADKMSKAHETEKHGLIPIEAINFLK